MLKNFICPNKTVTPIETCLEKCPFGSRCAPRSYLLMVADESEWDGIPSVTQLIRGTRESYLKIINEYSTDPDKAAFRVIGSKGHALLESYGVDNEISMRMDGIKGTLDSVEIENNELIVVDNKISGSYKVMKTLGMDVNEIETGEYFKNGNPKVKKEYSLNPQKSELNEKYNEWVLQFNMYAIMYEYRTDKKIDRLKVFMIARDGNTSMAKGRGILRNTYYVEVPILDTGDVLKYFHQKRDALLKAVESNEIPEPCTPEETWGGTKCKGYCDVVDFCDCPYL